MKMIIFTIVLLSLSTAAMACPVGYYQTVDAWGNQVCQPFGGQPQASVCPVGTYPWQDMYGNPICKRF